MGSKRLIRLQEMATRITTTKQGSQRVNTTNSQKKKVKAKSVQKAIKARVYYLSIFLGFCLFGLYLSYDLYNDPQTRSITPALLLVSLIALCLTVLNFFMLRVGIKKTASRTRQNLKKKDDFY